MFNSFLFTLLIGYSSILFATVLDKDVEIITVERNEKMIEMMTENYGNPSSLHRLGLESEKLVTCARDAIAEAIGADSSEIYFTSGATESSNTAILGAAKKFGKRKKNEPMLSVDFNPSSL